MLPGVPIQDSLPDSSERASSCREIDHDECSKAWRSNKFRETNGMRYHRAVGDRVYVNTGMRWREGVVCTLKSSTFVDVELVTGGKIRGVQDAPTHVQCFSSTHVVARSDGDGYDLRPTRRIEVRTPLLYGDKVRTDCPCLCSVPER